MKTVFEFAKEKMTKSISALNSEYNSIRAGRANPAVLDPIRVDYWGVPTPVNQMAAVSVAETAGIRDKTMTRAIARESSFFTVFAICMPP